MYKQRRSQHCRVADTDISANNYQNEQSEEWIGEWMEERKNRDFMVIATKFTTPYVGSLCLCSSEAQLRANVNCLQIHQLPRWQGQERQLLRQPQAFAEDVSSRLAEEAAHWYALPIRVKAVLRGQP